MACGISANLNSTGCSAIVGRFEQAPTQRDHLLMRRVEVIDVEVEMDLLRSWSDADTRTRLRSFRTNEVVATVREDVR
ncbi:hypothetical protein C1J01_07120 [Nonomuraea aridisoli]|uniref:Uncharacterized protein n=1 Tax=Nonomuraea aridisoli TaxID=2070368 RepID=A0A2W2EFA2_9ACTN|nr:hypothetical protein C1J01_07120 [Nonomuraea aridisoli]